MRRTLFTAVATLSTSLMMVGNARAQQTPAANPPHSPVAKTATANTGQASVPVAGKSTAAKTHTALTLKTPKDKASYALGMNIGRGLHRDSVDVDSNLLAQGIKDVMTGRKPLLTDKEAQAALTALQADSAKKQ